MNELDLFPLLMGLFGGLAIFLFGMEQMTDALRSLAGAGMSKVLGALTKNRFTAAITGALVTAVIQSSSVTTVLVVGFISAGIMSLPQSVGVIMGANIGTTITAQVIAFKVTQYALALIAIGFIPMFFTKRKKLKLTGMLFMGLGMIFLGMGIMSDSTSPLRTYEPFIDLMQRMDNPFLAILVAAAFTGLVQSSSATTGIVIVLASQGFITLEAGIALAFGANVGTCVTAVLAGLGKPAEAKQAAAVHLFFNVVGVLIWIPFIGFLASIVTSISPAHADLEGSARLAAETPRQIANAHTAFNIVNTFLFIWFTGPIATLVTKIIPKRPEKVPEWAKPKFLQDVFLETPALALDSVRRETMRLGRHANELSQDVSPAVIDGDDESLDAIVARARDNQRLYDAINEYIRRLSTEELTSAESRRLAALTSIAGHFQNMAETNAVNFVAIGRERLKKDVRFGAQTLERIRALGDAVREAQRFAIQSMEAPETARSVIEMKSEIQRQSAEVLEYLSGRLAADDPNRAVLYRLESQAVEMVLRQYYFAKKIAKVIVREAEASIEDPVTEVELNAASH